VTDLVAVMTEKNDLEKNYDDLKDERDSLKDKQDSLNDIIIECQRTNKEHQETLEKEKKKFYKLQTKIINAAPDSEKKVLAQQKATIDGLQVDNDSKDQELTLLKQELTKAKGEINDKERELKRTSSLVENQKNLADIQKKNLKKRK